MPDKIGRYKIIRLLGRGGMGQVWLAKDPFINREVAVKTTLGAPPKDPERLERFYETFFREAQAAGMLSHPNVVYVYDAAVEVDRCFMALEYVDGPTLKGYCQKDRLLPYKTVVNIVYQCAKGLYYAHEKGVTHRDIKPANIMIDQKKGVAKICDFGIAALEGLTMMEKKGQSAMTLGYASPEQLSGKTVTRQSDLFSLGVVLYELLTGHKPFEASTELGVIYKATTQPPTPIVQYRPDVPPPLIQIVARAMEKNPAQRYQSGREMAQDLSAYFAHLKTLEKEIGDEEKYHTLKRIDFFRDFSSKELAEVAHVTQWVDFRDGDSIIEEGTIQECFYIIVAGGVNIMKKGKVLARLNPGDYFGEMAYIGKTARTADAMAAGPTVLLRVDPTVIDQTSVNTQLRFLRIFTRTLMQRLAYTSEQFAGVSE